MNITVNGDPLKITDGLTLLQWLETHGEGLTQVIIEVNQEIIPQENWQEVQLQEGDQLEIFKFVGGG